MSKNTGSPLRQAINKHLYRKHGEFIGHGSTENRLIQHDILHAKGTADHEHENPLDPSEYREIE
jgi:hypothetical protein